MMVPDRCYALLREGVSPSSVLLQIGVTLVGLAAMCSAVLAGLWLLGYWMDSRPPGQALHRWKQAEPTLSRELADYARRNHQVTINPDVPPETETGFQKEPTGPGNSQRLVVTREVTYRLSPPGAGTLKANYIVSFQQEATPGKGPKGITNRLVDHYLDLNSVEVHRTRPHRPLTTDTGP